MRSKGTCIKFSLKGLDPMGHISQLFSATEVRRNGMIKIAHVDHCSFEVQMTSVLTLRLS